MVRCSKHQPFQTTHNVTLPEIRKIINKVQKKSFPDLKRTTNLFRMQSHQTNETHADVLKQVERAVEFGGVGTKDNFLLDYERLIVVITISLLPKLLQKELLNKFNSMEISQDSLRAWLDGQTVWEKGFEGQEGANI